jgi:hypothetical protein
MDGRGAISSNERGEPKRVAAELREKHAGELFGRAAMEYESRAKSAAFNPIMIAPPGEIPDS